MASIENRLRQRETHKVLLSPEQIMELQAYADGLTASQNDAQSENSTDDSVNDIDTFRE